LVDTVKSSIASVRLADRSPPPVSGAVVEIVRVVATPPEPGGPAGPVGPVGPVAPTVGT
jgi:hypothetical protein